MAAEKIVILGLDRAGKTVITNYLKTKSTASNFRPTLAFSINKFKIQNREFAIWDAPGQINLRSSWLKGIEHSKMIIYVIDAADQTRYEESFKEYKKILRKIYGFTIPLIFCYHKIDKTIEETQFTEIKSLFRLDQTYESKFYELKTSIEHPESILKIEEILLQET